MTVSGNVYDTVKDDSLIFSLAVYLSISQVLSADLGAGSRVSITPINDKKSVPGLPSLKNLKNAAHVRLVSTDTQEDSNTDRKSTRLNSSHSGESRMPSSA